MLNTSKRKIFILNDRPIAGMARSFLLFSIFLYTGFLQAQDLKDIVRQNNRKNYREALTIQTDRDFYVSGEQVWFKIQKLNASTDKPDNVSKVVYIELLNRSGFPVNQLKIAIKDFSGSSVIPLADTLSTGHYLLRAYTNWMKNFSRHDFAFKTITIIHPDKIPSLPLAGDRGPHTVLFFPEGGKLLDGIPVRVAIKALSSTGFPVQSNGIIVDRDQDTLCRVQIPRDSFGIFFIQPHKDKRYVFIPGNRQAGKKTFPLGRIHPTGFLLFRIPSDSLSILHLKIVRAPAGIAPTNGLLFLKKGGVYTFLKNITVADSLSVRLFTERFPPGISDILLTDLHGTILASHRFYQPPDALHIKVLPDKKKYGTRKKVSVTVLVTDHQNHPSSSELTVTVVKSGLLKPDRTKIVLRDPEKDYRLPGIAPYDRGINALFDFYPFPYAGSQSRITASSPHIKYMPELEDKIIKGTVTNYQTNQPLKHTEMFLSFIGKNARDILFSTSPSGDFFINTHQTGTRQIVIRPVDPATGNYYVELQQDFLAGTGHFLPGPYFPDTALLDPLENMIISKQIENIFQKYTLTDTLQGKKQPSFSFYGEPVERIQLSDYIPLSTVREVIKEIVPHVYIYKRKGKSYLRMDSEHYHLKLVHPLVLVDGTPFNDIDRLLKLPASEIEAVEVVNLRYFLGSHLFPGVIHFITKKGNLQALETEPGIFRIEYPVLNQKCTAVFPHYDTGENHHPPAPDFRNTLYWNPSLHTGSDGKATFEFYTPDETGTYTLYIEGISEDGERGTVRSYITIK